VATLKSLFNLLENKKFAFAVNLTLAAVGFYFTLQKIFNWSVSGALTQIFSFDAAFVAKVILMVWVLIACAAKLGMMYREHFPTSLTKLADPAGMNECVLRINDEITRHLAQVEKDPELASKTFLQGHGFNVNIALIVQNMAEHLMASFTRISVRSRDIFISVYEVPGFETESWQPTELEYVTHYDHKRDLVSSKRFSLSDTRYSDYECVKTVAAGKPVQVLFDCKKYASSRLNRHKTVKHYVGFRLEYADKTIGFINVEFHRHAYFPDEEKFAEFVERDMYAFRALIEYQFLKKKFFSAVNRALIARSVSSTPAVNTP